MTEVSLQRQTSISYIAAVDRLPPLGRPGVRQILALLCLLALSACAATSNNTSPPPDSPLVEAPDYTKANAIWRYHVVHTLHSGGYRSDADNADYEIQVRNGKYGIARLEGGKLVPPPLRGWLHAALPIAKIIEEKEQYFKFPLWVGKKWDGAQLLGRWRDTHCTVTGVETVTTPAGAFEAYRIERLMWFFVGTDNVYDMEVYFYSPQTRSVVKFDYKRETKDLVGDPKYSLEETAAFELLSYKTEPESSEIRSARLNSSGR